MTRKKLTAVLAAVLAAVFLLLPGMASAQEGMPGLMDIACEPTDILAMADGSFLVTDAYYKVIFRVQDGVSSLYAGTPTRGGLYGEPAGGYNDGTSDASTFRKPWAIVPFATGYAVTDTLNDCVRYISADVTDTITIGGLTRNVEWNRPTGLAAGDNGDLYVSDTGTGRICRISHYNGEVTVVCAGLNEPTGLCWSKGFLYIAETGANRILRWDGNTGSLMVLAGSGEAGCSDGAAMEAAFAWPLGVEAADDGTVFIADSGSCAIRMLRDGVVTTLMRADMEALDPYPSHPQGMLWTDGVLYVCDPFANRIYTVTTGDGSEWN